jgi:hypothetical protein
MPSIPPLSGYMAPPTENLIGGSGACYETLFTGT